VASQNKPTPYKYTRGSFAEADEDKFLVAFAATHQFTRSAHACGVSGQTVRNYMKKHPEFAERVAEVKAELVEKLEAEAYRRGVTGVQKPVVSMGDVVTHETMYSDKLLDTLLKANCPEKYRENMRIEHAGQTGVLLLPAPVSVEEWERLAAQLQTPAGAVVKKDEEPGS
jgi:hypothetical protein